ncbi:MAG TPA: hypothetical protein VFB12_13345 [Ktedonobacteraceae bacterium]|nr:hypothetical protein [Ktedonobacteraceae bacterium]
MSAAFVLTVHMDGQEETSENEFESRGPDASKPCIRETFHYLTRQCSFVLTSSSMNGQKRRTTIASEKAPRSFSSLMRP